MREPLPTCRAQRTVRDQLREFANISRRDSSAGAPPEPTGPAASRALPPAPLSDRSGADSADESHSTADASSTARDPMGTQDPSHPAAVASLLRVLGPDVEWGALPAALAWDPNAWAPRLVQQSEYSRLRRASGADGRPSPHRQHHSRTFSPRPSPPPPSTRARLCDRLERRVATLETHLARAKANLKRSNALAPTDLPPHIAAALAPTDPATPPHSTAHPSPTPSAAPRPDPHHEACGVRLWVSAPAGRGWVEQRSPACAAAAVAGAWNAVRPPSSPLFPGGLPRIQVRWCPSWLSQSHVLSKDQQADNTTAPRSPPFAARRRSRSVPRILGGRSQGGSQGHPVDTAGVRTRNTHMPMATIPCLLHSTAATHTPSLCPRSPSPPRPTAPLPRSPPAPRTPPPPPPRPCRPPRCLPAWSLRCVKEASFARGTSRGNGRWRQHWRCMQKCPRQSGAWRMIRGQQQGTQMGKGSRRRKGEGGGGGVGEGGGEGCGGG